MNLKFNLTFYVKKANSFNYNIMQSIIIIKLLCCDVVYVRVTFLYLA